MSNSLLNTAYKNVARKLCIDPSKVEEVYKSYWKFVKEHISDIGYVMEMSKEEIDSTDTNFNIPYIGKLYMDFTKLDNYKKQLKKYENATAKKN